MSDAAALWVAASIVVLALLALLLMSVVARRYLARRQRFQLAWTVGLFLVAVTLFEEALFALGVLSSPLLQSYFFLVAVLVGALSLGSTALALSPRMHRAYAAYVGATSLLAGWACFAAPIPATVVVAGIVTGNPPLTVLIASVLVTVPASVLMVAISLWTAYRQRRWQLLYIAAGIVVISAAGGLYIASVPVTLYYAEFVGVFLLFLGFLKLPSPAASPSGRAATGPSPE